MSERHITAKDRRARGDEVDYLGDGVYVAHDGFGMWLTAEDGMQATDGIYIEPNVWEALKRFIERMDEAQDRKLQAMKSSEGTGSDG